MANRLTIAAAVVTALSLRAAAAEPPAAQKLEPSPVRPAERDPAARSLPPVVTVCRDAGGRCWTEPGESGCAASEARPFRVVIAGPGRDDESRALRDCRMPEGAE